jgi:hypothetical protein
VTGHVTPRQVANLTAGLSANPPRAVAGPSSAGPCTSLRHSWTVRCRHGATHACCRLPVACVMTCATSTTLGACVDGWRTRMDCCRVSLVVPACPADVTVTSVSAGQAALRPSCAGATRLPSSSAQQAGQTIRSGATTSRYTPVHHESRPSGDRIQQGKTPLGVERLYRQAPCSRAAPTSASGAPAPSTPGTRGHAARRGRASYRVPAPWHAWRRSC